MIDRKAYLAMSLAAPLLLFSWNVSGMTFDVVTMKGEPAILGRGEITAGDADRFRAVLTPRARHSYGYYTLVLESPGGSVKAAFELAQAIDSEYVNTYVAPAGRCVSACAAIVFIAGREHVTVQGGYLGFHGCFNSETNEIHTMCNEAIAEHAVTHGTAYGAVMSFIRNIPSHEIVWISGTEADCWGINRYDISPEPAAYLQCVRDIVKELNR